MEYALTGATGFLGGYVVDELLDDGHDLVALARTPSKAGDLESRGVEVVEGDITDKESMREPMSGADGVFHMAAWYKVGTDPTSADAINVDGTRNVMELVDELDIEKAVYTSTLAVNSDTGGRLVDESYRFSGEHLSHYDRTKWEAHYEVVEPMAADGVPIVTVMPGVIYGPGDTSQMRGLWADYVQEDLPVVPRKTAYCFAHVEDIARAHVAAMDQGEVGEDYIIAGEPYTLVEALALAEQITGIPAPRAISPRWFALMSSVASVLDRVVDLPSEYNPESLRVLAGATYLGDNSKATAELGLEHRPFEEGLREYLEWQMNEQGVTPRRSI